MKELFDVEERTVSLTAPKALYSRDALGIAAHIFAGRAEVYLEESAKAWRLSLKARRALHPQRNSQGGAGRSAAAGQPELRALAGEFLNELLNQEYRFLVSRFNAKISNLIVAQTLLSARGGEKPPQPPAEEKTPQFQAEVDQMMAEAKAEIERTMPARIAPQGSPCAPDAIAGAEESLG